MKFTKKEREIIEAAKVIFEEKALYKVDIFTSPELVKTYLQTHFAGKEREVFTVLYLDTAHKLIACIDECEGTIDAASIYPREIIKSTLKHNAAAVILAHNHPSGSIEVSRADKAITKRLKNALDVIDVRVLDHFIVGSRVVSMAEHGLI